MDSPVATRPSHDTVRRALVGAGLATLAAYLCLPVFSFLLNFDLATISFDPLEVLAGLFLFPSETLRSFELDLGAEALQYTWWFYLPAGVLFGLCLPRRSSRQTRSRAAMEGALMGGALGVVGGIAAVCVVWASEGLDDMSLREGSSLFLLAVLYLAPYCALWVAGFAAAHAQRA
jgi:hypothetical protein